MSKTLQKITENLMVFDEQGNEAHDVDCVVQNCDIINANSGGYRADVAVDIYLPSATSGSGNISGTGTDPTSSVRVNLTIYFSLSDYNGATYGVLTRFSGTYSVLQSGVSVTNRRVNYYTTGANTAGIKVNSQQKTYYVSSTSFSKYTGYSIPVLLSAEHFLGAAWQATVNRGGSSWSFSLPVTY